MLMNLNKKSWVDGLTLRDYNQHCRCVKIKIETNTLDDNLNLLFPVSLNQDTVGEMLKLAKDYDKALGDEEKMTPEQLAIKNVGKLDPKRHLEEKVDVLMTNNVVQLLGAMLDTIVFK